MQYYCQALQYRTILERYALTAVAVAFLAAGTRVVDTYVTWLRTRHAHVDRTAMQVLCSENVQLPFNCGWGHEGVTEQGSRYLVNVGDCVL